MKKMKHIKNTFNKMHKIFLLVLILTSTASLSAQILPGGNDNVQDVGDGVPLDGGISLIVAIAGAAVYGVKSLRESKNE